MVVLACSVPEPSAPDLVMRADSDPVNISWGQAPRALCARKWTLRTDLSGYAALPQNENRPCRFSAEIVSRRRHYLKL